MSKINKLKKMKKVTLILTIEFLFVLIFSSCSESYNKVTIGEQIWMTENLNVDKFSNGDPIPMAKTREEWLEAGENYQPAWCYYDNDSINNKNYGKLYNFHAVSDPRGLAPEGWKIPTANDWEILITNSGGVLDADDKLKNTFGWDNENGSNELGFSANAGGTRYWNTAKFSKLRRVGYWWTSTSKIDNKKSNYEEFNTPFWRETGVFYVIGIKYNGEKKICSFDEYKGAGMSVRLIKE